MPPIKGHCRLSGLTGRSMPHVEHHAAFERIARPTNQMAFVLNYEIYLLMPHTSRGAGKE